MMVAYPSKSEIARRHRVKRAWVECLIREHDLPVIEGGKVHLLPPETVDRLGPILDRIGSRDEFVSDG